MRHARKLLQGACLLMLLGCERAAPKHVDTTPPRWMLNETFPAGNGSCRVASARQHLTEAKLRPESTRVAPDVHAIALALSCEDAAGRALSTTEALPKEAVILLITPDGEHIAPNERTWLSEEQP